MSEIISLIELKKLIDDEIKQGRHVAAPRRVDADRVLYERIDSSEKMTLDGFLRPINSIKEFVFPKHEKLYGYRLEGKEIKLLDAEPSKTEQIVIGARPCDAAALPILDHVFNWDFKDDFYNQRRELTTVVTLACQTFDASCFCTSVGLSPSADNGSDAMLFDLGAGEYEVRCLTEKGKKLFAGRTKSSDKVGKPSAGPEKKLPIDDATKFMDDGFENPIWKQATLRCLGCGACAFNCPTCHCFDIADEGNSVEGGRYRNWDGCQFGLYSLHASGHNPRAGQGQRQRQRLYHKFETYPEKFGVTLCTGCGNCTRNCPVELGVRPVLEALAKK